MPTEEFKKNALVQKIEKALVNAATLDIKTVVGPVDFTSDVSTIQFAAKAQGMRSTIGLASGDVVTQIDPSFADDGPYASMREFHLSRERQGQAIVKQNVEIMRELLSFVWELVEPKNPAAADDGQ